MYNNIIGDSFANFLWFYRDSIQSATEIGPLTYFSVDINLCAVMCAWGKGGTYSYSLCNLISGEQIASALLFDIVLVIYVLYV